MKFSISKLSHTKALTQTVTGFGLMAITQLMTSGVAHASLEDSAKDTGSQIYTLVSIFGLVISVVMLAVGWSMHATGSREGMENGKKRIMHALISVGGILLGGVIISWVYGAFSKAGGGIGITYPF